MEPQPTASAVWAASPPSPHVASPQAAPVAFTHGVDADMGVAGGTSNGGEFGITPWLQLAVALAFVYWAFRSLSSWLDLDPPADFRSPWPLREEPPRPPPSRFQRVLAGVLLASEWLVLALLATCFLLAPAALVLPALGLLGMYEAWMSTIIAAFLRVVSSTVEAAAGVRVVFTGDRIPASDGGARVLVITNHPTRNDWAFLLPFFSRIGRLAHLRYVMSDFLLRVPGMGTAMDLANWIFLQRRWDADREAMAQRLAMWVGADVPAHVVLFPEGTDLSRDNLTRGRAYAESKGLPVYSHVMHPRTTGFVHCVQALRPSFIYDVTVAYTGHRPQNESDLLAGRFPDEVHIHVRRHCMERMRQEPQALASWLENCFVGKERMLSAFYKMAADPSASPAATANSGLAASLRSPLPSEHDLPAAAAAASTSPLAAAAPLSRSRSFPGRRVAPAFPDEVKDDEPSMFSHGLSMQVANDPPTHWPYVVLGILATAYLLHLLARHPFMALWMALFIVAHVLRMAMRVRFGDAILALYRWHRPSIFKKRPASPASDTASPTSSASSDAFTPKSKWD